MIETPALWYFERIGYPNLNLSLVALVVFDRVLSLQGNITNQSTSKEDRICRCNIVSTSSVQYYLLIFLCGQ